MTFLIVGSSIVALIIAHPGVVVPPRRRPLVDLVCGVSTVAAAPASHRLELRSL
jgi:hypothetical protein